MDDIISPNIPDLALTERLTGGSYIGFGDVLDDPNIIQRFNVSSYEDPEPAYVIYLDKGYYYDFSVSSDSDPIDLIVYDRSDRALILNDESNDPDNTDLITDFSPDQSNFYTVVFTLSEADAGEFSFVIEQKYLDSLQATENYLSTLGVSMDEARQFIVSHAETSPEIIFETAQQYDISNQMLADIVGVRESLVRQFWAFEGFDYTSLD